MSEWCLCWHLCCLRQQFLVSLLIQGRVFALKAALNFLWMVERIRCDPGWGVTFASQTLHMHVHVHILDGNPGEMFGGSALVPSLCWLMQYLEISLHRRRFWLNGSCFFPFSPLVLARGSDSGFLQRIRWQSWLSPVYCCCCYISIVAMQVWSIAWRMKLLIKTQLLVSSFLLLAYGWSYDLIIWDKLMRVTHQARYVVP